MSTNTDKLIGTIDEISLLEEQSKILMKNLSNTKNKRSKMLSDINQMIEKVMKLNDNLKAENENLLKTYETTERKCLELTIDYDEIKQRYAKAINICNKFINMAKENLSDEIDENFILEALNEIARSAYEYGINTKSGTASIDEKKDQLTIQAVTSGCLSDNDVTNPSNHMEKQNEKKNDEKPTEEDQEQKDFSVKKEIDAITCHDEESNFDLKKITDKLMKNFSALGKQN